MKKEKLKPVVISMKRWARSVPETWKTTSDNTCLYDPHTKMMCCLGFDARQVRGLRAKDIKGVYFPSSVGIDDWQGRGCEVVAIDINDSPTDLGIKTTAQQKTALKNLFKKMGRKLTFVP